VGTVLTLPRYLKEFEKKTDLKKARKIAAARMRAADVLKPKEFDDEQKIRLKQLKKAKAARQRSRSNSYNNNKEGAKSKKAKKQRSESSSINFYGHSHVKRFWIITAMCCVLAITIYPDFLLSEFDKVMIAYEQSWFLDLTFDTGCLVYICLCSTVHFAVCYISMIYTFCSLELGMKAGRQTKQYYDTSVRTTIVTMSGSIALFSVGKAILKVLARVLTWNSIRVWSMVSNILPVVRAFAQERLLPSNGFWVSSIFGFVSQIIHYILQISCFVLQSLCSVLLRTNRVGMFIEWMIMDVGVKAILSLKSNWNTYVHHVFAIYQDSKTIPAWRYDAIETARLLFTYTTVFLVTVLILFNLSSKVNKLAVEKHLQKYFSIEKKRKTNLPVEVVINNEEVEICDASSLDVVLPDSSNTI